MIWPAHSLVGTMCFRMKKTAISSVLLLVPTLEALIALTKAEKRE